ncbi:MAG: Uma2 family endonuclease [Acidobacteriota bacterium]|nr:Uma2 family endonuclease [Acidobacteriota bacterium]
MSRMTGHQHTGDARASTRKLTYQDFRHFPDDGQRHELIDGEHYVTPSPNARHQDLSLRLILALGNHLAAHPGGRLFHAPFDCVFTDFDIVEPDLLWIAADQLGIITEKHVRGVPALVVEILSPGTRRVDETVKRRLYDRVGVREYWIVDPKGRVSVYRRTDGRLALTSELSPDLHDTLTTPLLPGFVLPLADYFR